MCEGASGKGRDDVRPPSLYKTTAVIWSKFSGEEIELEHLAREATAGEAYCSRYRSEYVEKPESDPAWEGTEF